MITKTFNKSAWIVVEVHSGIPISVKAFQDQELATEYSETLRKNLNLDNDEVGIFEVDFSFE